MKTEPTLNLRTAAAPPLPPTKPKFLPAEAVRPTDLADPSRIYDDNSLDIPMRDDSSFTLAVIEQDSFFGPSPHDVGTMRRYPPGYDYPKQHIYYDDGYGNDRLPFPEEISF